jgi:hypothetical protein
MFRDQGYPGFTGMSISGHGNFHGYYNYCVYRYKMTLGFDLKFGFLDRNSIAHGAESIALISGIAQSAEGIALKGG